MSDVKRPPRPHRSPREVLFLARRHLARTALLVSILAPLLIAAGVFGVREEMFSYEFGLDTLILGLAPQLAMLGVILGVVAVILAFVIAPRRERTTALAALAIAGLTLAAHNHMRASVAGAPPIHDVATDWREPLNFGPGSLAARGPGSLPVLPNPVIGGQRLADINARTCPGAVPVVLATNPQQAFDRAKAALQREGLEIVTENPAAGRIEAVATGRWFRLKDDVIVRVRPEGAGSRIDMRSISRTGVSDYGANCRRITRLRQAMA